MNRHLARLTAFGLVAAFAAAAHGQAKDQPRYLSAAQLSAMVAKTTNGVASGPLPLGPGAVIINAHRDGPGEVEIHAMLNDEFVVRSGHAQVLIGEKVEGGRETAPGERRGGTIVGGKTYDLAPGDVLWIPAGLGHLTIVPKGGSFDYLAVKFPVVQP